jgi:hypothetical protein
MGDKLTVWSAPESGMEIELSTQATHTYAAAPASCRSWFAGKLAQRKS